LGYLIHRLVNQPKSLGLLINRLAYSVHHLAKQAKILGHWGNLLGHQPKILVK